MKPLLIVVLLSMLAPAARACRGLDSESKTFFTSLPTRAESRSLVARVKVLSTQIKGSVRVTKATVVTGIKGTKANAQLTIESEIHSCSRDPDVKAGEEFFIAGSIGTGGTFRGPWKFADWPKADGP